MYTIKNIFQEDVGDMVIDKRDPALIVPISDVRVVVMRCRPENFMQDKIGEMT